MQITMAPDKDMNLGVFSVHFVPFCASSLKTTGLSAHVYGIEDLSISPVVYQPHKISVTLYLMHIMQTNQMPNIPFYPRS